MRFLIIGAGAIGGYVGASLARAGNAVTFLARPGRAESLERTGLRLRAARGGPGVAVRGFTLARSAGEALAQAQYEALILTVKAFDTARALNEVRAATEAPPPIVCLQNGVDGEAEAARLFGVERVIAGTVTTPVSKASEVEIVVERERGLGLALGHPLSRPLAEAFSAAGLKTRLYARAGPMKWSKLLTNLVGNATSAILDMPVSEVYADPQLFALEARALRECEDVMRALGYPIVDLPGVPVRALAWAFRRLPAAVARPLLRRFAGGGRGGKMPSLHVALHGGRPQTEVGWLNGAVVRHGQALGVATPANQVLTETLEALTAGRLDREAFRGRPEALVSRLERNEG